MGKKRLSIFFLLLAVGATCWVSSGYASTPTNGPLRVSDINPRYFADKDGNVVYLTGSHVWNNLKDFGQSNPPDPFSYDSYLDFLKRKNHNFFRLWTWELAKFSFEGTTIYVDPFPWQHTGPGKTNDGKLKFDLNSFNQDYFDRLRDRVIEARDQGIYVSIMLFDGFAMQNYVSSSDGYPFDGDNNINGIDVTGVNSNKLNNPAQTFQETYVKKVIDTLNDLNNVLYEICNEAGPYSTSWQYHMIDLIRDYESTKPYQHPVGMTFQYEGGSNSTLFNSDADWISPNSNNGYIDNPPISDGDKVVISDSDHLWGEGGDAAWVWKNFTRGLNTLFMDGGIQSFPETKDWRESARNAMGVTLTYANKIDLAEALPEDSYTVCSTTYCLVNPGKQYLVYQPGSGKFSINLIAGTYEYEWVHPTNGSIIDSGTLTVESGTRPFAPPSGLSSNAVLFLNLLSGDQEQPADLESISLNPATVEGGESSVGTVMLTGPAPANGATVLLDSSSEYASVPDSVTVPQGGLSASFTVTTNTIDLTDYSTIFATYNDIVFEATLTISPTQSEVGLSSLSLTPTSVVSGESSQGTVTLTAPAPAGGATITLSDDSWFASLPASVTVPQGSTSASFTINTKSFWGALTRTISTTITASYNGVTLTNTLSISPPEPSVSLDSLSLTPTSVVGGESSQGTVTLTAPAPAGGATITLSDDSWFASLPASVTVPQGSTSTSFTINTKSFWGALTRTISTTITASYDNATCTTTLTISPIAASVILPVTPRRLR